MSAAESEYLGGESFEQQPPAAKRALVPSIPAAPPGSLTHGDNTSSSLTHLVSSINRDDYALICPKHGGSTVSSVTDAEIRTKQAEGSPKAQESRGLDERDKSDEYEAIHVHSVYSSIASHFSSTRYKPWPKVSSFLESRQPGAVGFDVGCGNGKYIGVNKSLFMIGSDMCRELLICAQDRLRTANPQVSGDPTGRTSSKHREHDTAHEVTEPGKTISRPADESLKQNAQPAIVYGGDATIQADILALPFKRDTADFAVCIAVLHHLSTPERRIEAISAVLQCLRPGGQALLYVWALEQGSSRRGWQEGGDQDLLVPWVMKNKKEHNQGTETEETSTYRRYYHLFAKGELEQNVHKAQGKVIESGYDRDNWWVVCEKI